MTFVEWLEAHQFWVCCGLWHVALGAAATALMEWSDPQPPDRQWEYFHVHTICVLLWPLLLWACFGEIRDKYRTVRSIRPRRDPKLRG